MYEFQSEIAPQTVYTVSQLNQEIKTLLETTLPVIWLEGEISNLKLHSSGHVYFSLKDKDSQISAVMWRSRKANLFFTPQDGMKVLALGRVNVFHKRGYYQFDVIKLQPAGVGELQVAFEQLKQKLLEEGLFEEEHKKPIPSFPDRIGIVTSLTGAAIQDLLNIINRRFPGLEIVVNPVKVQGEGAAEDIAAALDDFNEYGKVDILIVGRGGGSLEDLWAFNEEAVARAIYRSKIPVISAVGHEIDYTISDFVADLRAPTPSAAAELAVPDREELFHRIQMLKKDVLELAVSKIRQERERLKGLVKSYSFMRTPDIVKQKQQQLDELVNGMKMTVRHHFDSINSKTKHLEQRLRALAPDSVLKRGYSICKRIEDGLIIRNAEALKEADKLKIKFYQGSAISSVDKIEKADT